MSGWDPARFWPSFARAGMLTPMTFALRDCPVPTTIDVRFSMPDEVLGNDSRSRQYTIEYQHDDLPSLTEGVECEVLEGRYSGRYRVRETPFVPNDHDSASGFFRRTTLTRIGEAGP